MKKKRIIGIRLGIIAVSMLISFTLHAEPDPTVSNSKPEWEKAQTIAGLVTDERTAEPLAGVAMLYNGQTFYSDLEGKFTLPITDEKKGKVDVSFISYQAKSLDVAAIQEGEIKISLKPF